MRVLIAGAGVAGLAAACHLLNQGHDVTVVEKHRGGIDKVCGEGVLPFGMDLFDELGLASHVQRLGYPFPGIEYSFENYRAIGSFPAGSMGYGIERRRLDTLMRQACNKYKHFQLLEGTRIQDLSLASYDAILGADGVRSPIARLYGIRKRESPRKGMRFRIRTDPGERVQVHFFRWGEVYLTPTGPNALSVAILLDQRGNKIPGKDLRSRSLRRFFEAFPHLSSCEPQQLAIRAPIATSSGLWFGHTPHIHLLGDAFRAFDPISGAGMSFALLCAKQAALHLNDPCSYYRALRPAIHSINEFTSLLLFFRGGGWRTRLMLRQLSKTPKAFSTMLSLHNGRARPYQLNGRTLISLLGLR